MQLSELTGRNGETGGIEIRGLALDSRRVQPGYLFAALSGDATDGKEFIPDALARGAVAVLTEPGEELDVGGACLVEDENPRLELARMAALYYRPQPATTVAVTGTNGKTSVAHFCKQIWSRLGHDAGSIGTLGVESDVFEQCTGLTTPDSVSLHRSLQKMANAGIDHVALEASSHGLAQYRLDGVAIRAGAFTNLSRDHLDYHETFDEYLETKCRLFTEIINPLGSAVINRDGAFATEFEERAVRRGLRIISVGEKGETLRLKGREYCRFGQRLWLEVKGEELQLCLPLIGDFQASNALVAAGLVIATGGDVGGTLKALERLSGVPGRMDYRGVTNAGGALYVDYAHTPDGLATALSAARAHVSGKLHVVFGCGGDRDAGKRPQMGRIASELADRVVVTDDNPRSEDGAQIRKEILASAPNASEIADRADAIRSAAQNLGEDDLLIVAGKGHERGQIIGETVVPFSDIDVVDQLVVEEERAE